MKTLQKRVQVLYRFRCERYVMEKDMYRFVVMDDGTEIMEY